MILLSIGYSKASGDMYERLKELCGYFKNKGVNIALAESDLGKMHYIKCILKDTEQDIKSFENSRDMFYVYASNVIYEFISREYEIDLLEKLLREKYSYLDSSEQEEIRDRCISIILGSGMFTTEDLLVSVNRRNNILKKLDEFLQESSEIILDGFITFRLRDINDELTEIIDKVVEEYIIEREYSEFIKLLKYFVDIQDSKYQEVNIYINAEGEYIVEDKDGANITSEFFEDFDIENIKGEINKHDILISALITSAPEKISIHGIENSKSQEAIDTIKSIFLDKVVFCIGCDRCKSLPEANVHK